MIIGVVILAGVLVLGLFVALALRRVTLDEAKTEERLRSPATHTVAYAVPPGQDPAVLIAALSRAGFTAVSELREGNEELLVECPEDGDRAQVRSIIEHVHRTSFEGQGDQIQVAHVSFEDER